jgi:tetratricopeptide (TPR) repeat protein
MTLLLAVLLFTQSHSDVEQLNTAQKLMDGGRCAEAIPLLQKLVTSHPQAPMLRYGLGRCYFETGDYNQATIVFRDLTKQLPRESEIHFFLGSSIGLSGNIAEAFPELRKAIELDPKFEPAWRAFGMFRVQMGLNSKDALDALETAVRLDPNDGRALYWLGELQRSLGDNTKARTYFERASKLDQADPMIQVGLGQVLLDDGELETALTLFDSALKVEPSFVSALLGKARALYQSDRAAQALAPAQAARQGAIRFEDVKGSEWLLCRIYRALGRDQEAEQAERAVRQLEQSFSEETARAQQLSDEAARASAEGKTEQANAALERLLKIRPNDADALIRLGDGYMALHRPADAERCYSRAGVFGVMTAELNEKLHKAQALVAEKIP